MKIPANAYTDLHPYGLRSEVIQRVSRELHELSNNCPELLGTFLEFEPRLSPDGVYRIYLESCPDAESCNTTFPGKTFTTEDEAWRYLQTIKLYAAPQTPTDDNVRQSGYVTTYVEQYLDRD